MSSKAAGTGIAWAVIAIFLEAWPALGQAGVEAALPAGGEGGGGIGQEMRTVEEGLSDMKPPAEPPKVPPSLELPAPEAAPLEDAPLGPQGTTFTCTTLEVRGDREVLEQEGLIAGLESRVLNRPMTGYDFLTAASEVQGELRNIGYYMAQVTVPSPLPDYSKGTAIYDVDIGRFGTMTFVPAAGGAGVEAGQTEFKGRYFSRAQLERSLSDLQRGNVFDYRRFYRALYDINANPDVRIDTLLSIKKDEGPDGRIVRYANMTFTVHETSPMHTILEVENTGTKSTGDWRVSVVGQDLNVSKHDDIATIRATTSETPGALFSLAGSYAFPHYVGHGGNLSLYGGWSRIDSDEIVEDITIEGSGWFTGAHASYRLLRTDAHDLRCGLGVVYRYVQDRLLLDGVAGADRSANLLPLVFALNYSSVRSDAWGGKNFFTSETSYNLGGMLGVSDEADFNAQRFGSETDYLIERIQVARLQPFLGTKNEKTGRMDGQWALFGKLDAQLSNGALVPAEQKALGGMLSVRGYLERETLGDQGVSGTLELRTPLTGGLLELLLGPKAAGGDEAESGVREPRDRAQFLAFIDGGYVTRSETLQGEDTSQFLLGVGLGVRWSIAERGQIRMDLGMPLEDTPDSDGPSVHVSGRLQF